MQKTTTYVKQDKQGLPNGTKVGVLGQWKSYVQLLRSRLYEDEILITDASPNNQHCNKHMLARMMNQMVPIR